MKEVRSFPTTCQCWHEGDSKSIVVMEGQDWGDTAPLAHLKLWFVTAPKGFCFRESFLLPKLILSLPSAAEVWFSTSLEPGCAAGCWGKPTHVQPNSSCISCVQWKETSASSTHFGAIPYNFSCNLKWEAGRGRLSHLRCSAEVSSSMFLTELWWPWGNRHFCTHCPRGKEEAGRTTWLLGDAGTQISSS